MSTKVEISPEIVKLVKDCVKEEVEKRVLGVREDWSQARVVAAMERLEERRKRIALPREIFDEIIEEHRRDFGRGPLVDAESAGES